MMTNRAQKQNKKTLAIVGTVGLPAIYGGWETLVANIVDSLTEEYDVTVYCSALKYEVKAQNYNNAKLKYINLNANGISSIPYDVLSLWHARKSDKVLILGTSGCLFLPIFRILTRAHYYLNIDGLEWKRDKWSKLAKTYLKLSEIVGCKFSHKLIADNAVIQRHILENHKKDSALIAYGGDAPKSSLENSSQIEFAPTEYAFSVCRIEPENNSGLILEAFAELTEYPLVFVGNWLSSEYGRQLKEKYAAYPNLSLLDPIYDRAELDKLRSKCKIYIHGHSAGGTNPSLVEAMNLALPVFAFDVDFNRETTEDSARYFEDTEELADLVNTITEEDLQSVAIKMSEIAERRYTWSIIRKQYLDLLS